MENTYNNITVDPVYFLHRVIRDVKGNINQKLSECIHETFEKEIYGCQYIKGVWFVYMPANGIRELLLNNGITLENSFITFYNEYPQNQTFSNISARIWNSLMVNLDIDVSLIKFKESLKQYLLNNVLIIKYTK